MNVLFLPFVSMLRILSKERNVTCVMQLLFKQRFFSWFDSYDIFDETGAVAFTVKGKLSWGHCLEIYDRTGFHVGTVKEEVLTFLPRFALYQQGAIFRADQERVHLFSSLLYAGLQRLTSERGSVCLGLHSDRSCRKSDHAGVKAAVPMDGYLCDRRGEPCRRFTFSDDCFGYRRRKLFAGKLSLSPIRRQR